MVRLVEDQQAAGEAVAEPLPHRLGVGVAHEQVVGDEEAAVGPPGVHAVAPVEAHPGEVAAVEDLEAEAEALLHLGPPLFEDRGGRGDHDGPHLLAQQEFAGDEARLDGLPEPGVVGDEEPHTGHRHRHSERLHLVGIQLDPGPEGGLEQPGIGRRDRVPAERVHVGGEPARGVKTARPERRPRFGFQDAAVRLAVPEDFEFLALGVVVRAGQGDAGGMAGGWGRDHPVHEPRPLANLDELADLRWGVRQAGV